MTASVEPRSGDAVPNHLDAEMIMAAVAKVTTHVMSCGDRSPTKGRVLVSVTVAASGCVSAVSVESTPDPPLGICVATAIQRATFSKTATGGSFHYPFVF